MQLGSGRNNPSFPTGDLGSPQPSAGRFAPSPSGDLHLGNLRTALLAWLFARSTCRQFKLRIEDLDRVATGSEQRQLHDLAAVGVTFDGEPLRQSDRLSTYDIVIDELTDRGLTFECFCTRREILDAPSAPHQPPGTYRGNCRNLTSAQRAERRLNRPPAVRLLSEAEAWTIHDDLHGEYTGVVDDFVLRRNDGVVAYNLAVVVDDAAQGVDQVVRGDDLLTSAPRQAYLAQLIGHDQPRYAHVPLVVNSLGKRLAKRDGAVTYRQLKSLGYDPLQLIASSLGMTAGTAAEMLEEFDPASLTNTPWIFAAPRTDSSDSAPQ